MMNVDVKIDNKNDIYNDPCGPNFHIIKPFSGTQIRSGGLGSRGIGRGHRECLDTLHS